MKNDVGNNQGMIVMTALITGGIATFLCCAILSIRSCEIQTIRDEMTRDMHTDVAKYSAMAECAKAHSPLECEQLFKK